MYVQWQGISSEMQQADRASQNFDSVAQRQENSYCL